MLEVYFENNKASFKCDNAKEFERHLDNFLNTTISKRIVTEDDNIHLDGIVVTNNSIVNVTVNMYLDEELDFLFKRLHNKEGFKLYFYQHDKDNTKTMQIIAEILKESKTIKEISLDDSKLKENDLSLILDALKVNNSVKHANLSWNDIKNNSLKSLLEVLKNNNTIESINLRRIDLFGEDLIPVLEALKHNKSIRKIETGDQFTYNQIPNLISLLKANRNILEFPFYDVMAREDDLKLIKSLLKLNKYYYKATTFRSFCEVMLMSNSHIQKCKQEQSHLANLPIELQENILIQMFGQDFFNNHKLYIDKPFIKSEIEPEEKGFRQNLKKCGTVISKIKNSLCTIQ